ncbi:DUF31 family putative serine protease [Candidatus Mycoplasma pogonae]
MFSNKKPWSRIWLSLFGLLVIIVSAGGAGYYFINEARKSQFLNPINIPNYNISGEDIVKAEISQAYSNVKASQFNKIVNNIKINDLKLTLRPNVSENQIKSRYNFSFAVVKNSANDDTGTLLLELQLSDKNTTSPKNETKNIVLSGFVAKQNFVNTEELWFSNRLNEIKNLKLKNPNQKLTTENFWEVIDTSQSFLQLAKNNYSLKAITNPNDYSLIPSVEVIDEVKKQYAVLLKLQANFDTTKNLSKVFLINTEFNQANWKLNLDSELEKLLLPANLASLSSNQLGQLFLKDLTKSQGSVISIINQANNNANGDIYLVEKTIDNKLNYAHYKLNNYNKLFNQIISDNKDFLKNQLLEQFSLSNPKDYHDMLQIFNDSSRYNYRFAKVISELKEIYKHRSQKLFEKYNIFDVTEIFDLKNPLISKINDKNYMIWEFVDLTNTVHSVYYEFAKTNSKETDFNSQNLAIKSSTALAEEIQKRSISLSFLAQNNNDNSVYIYSGTGWVIDKSLEEKNTYFIATNIHVVENAEAKWNNISGFAYSLYNDRDEIYNISGDKTNLVPINPFITNRNSYDFRRYTKQYQNQKSSELRQINNDAHFWESFKIYNVGAHVSNQYGMDLAVIKIKFDADVIDQNGQIIEKNIPDAVHYYEKQQQNPLTKLRFITQTNNSFKWPQREYNYNFNFINQNDTELEIHIGGYLGGTQWVYNSSSAWLSNTGDLDNQIVYYNNYDSNNPERHALIRNNYQVSSLYTRVGKGMSGSMALDQYGRVIGIFWGSAQFRDRDNNTLNDENAKILNNGAAKVELIGIKVPGAQKSLLEAWLELTQDQITELDNYDLS